MSASTNGTTACLPRTTAPWIRSKGRVFLATLLLAALPLLALGSVCGHDFVSLDDDWMVVDNPLVSSGLTWGGFVRSWAPYKNQWHPLTWWSLQLDRGLFGPGPTGFHRTNLLLHVANGLLLFWALRRLTGALWRSALAAGLFALHPLNVESAAWVSARPHLLAVFFGFAALGAYAEYARRPSRGRYLLVVLPYVLSLLAKPLLATLPALLVLLDYWPLGRWRPAASPPPRSPAAKPGRPTPSSSPAASFFALCREKWPLLLPALVVSGITIAAAPQGDLDGVLPLDERLRCALVAYWQYLGNCCCPVRLILCYQRPFPVWSWFQAAGAAGLLVLLSLLALRFAGGRRYLVVGWLWYLGTFVPVIGLVPKWYYDFADRYTYVPLIGVFLLAAWGLGDLLSRFRRGALGGAALGAALLAGCFVCSWRQVGYWHDSFTLWGRSLRVEPNNLIANIEMGACFLRQGDAEQARTHCAAAVRVCEEQGLACPHPYRDLGDALWLQGKTDEATALYARAVEFDPSSARTHHKLGLGLLRQGRPRDAERHFRAVLALEPESAQLDANLGAALYNQGRIDEAAERLTEAVRLRPDYAAGCDMLGTVLQRQGKLAEAIRRYSEALRLDAGLTDARAHLARALQEQQRATGVGRDRRIDPP